MPERLPKTGSDVGTKATITYQCTKPGYEQQVTWEAEVEQDGYTKVTVKFDPPISDDTNDPTGVLTKMLQAFGMIAQDQDEDESIYEDRNYENN